MIVRTILNSTLILLASNLTLQGQPTYNNGHGQGYSMISTSTSTVLVYDGGFGQGYANAYNIDILQNNFNGGANDGYTAEYSEMDSPLYSGGTSDGHDEASPNPILMSFLGGADDGYTSEDVFEPFIWTGAIGTGWNVAGNWNRNIIPDILRPVIIPDGVPNWPMLNAGIFRVGSDTDQLAAFKCGNILIESNAQMVARVNSYIENYNQFSIEGLFTLRNPAFGSFSNFVNGNLIIETSGNLIFE